MMNGAAIGLRRTVDSISTRKPSTWDSVILVDLEHGLESQGNSPNAYVVVVTSVHAVLTHIQ